MQAQDSGLCHHGTWEAAPDPCALAISVGAACSLSRASLRHSPTRPPDSCTDPTGGASALALAPWPRPSSQLLATPPQRRFPEQPLEAGQLLLEWALGGAAGEASLAVCPTGSCGAPAGAEARPSGSPVCCGDSGTGCGQSCGPGVHWSHGRARHQPGHEGARRAEEASPLETSLSRL